MCNRALIDYSSAVKGTMACRDMRLHTEDATSLEGFWSPELLQVINVCSDLSHEGRRQYFRKVAREAIGGSPSAIVVPVDQGDTSEPSRAPPSESSELPSIHSSSVERAGAIVVPAQTDFTFAQTEMFGRSSSAGEGFARSCSSLSSKSPSTESDERHGEEVLAIRKERNEREKLRRFLEKHGFGGICSRRICLLTGGVSTLPLHRAAASNNTEMVKLLLNARAKPSHTDGRGRKALQIAQQKDRNCSFAATIAVLKDAECPRPGSPPTLLQMRPSQIRAWKL